MYNLTLKKINQVLVDINRCTDPEIIQIIDIVLNHRLALRFDEISFIYFVYQIYYYFSIYIFKLSHAQSIFL